MGHCNVQSPKKVRFDNTPTQHLSPSPPNQQLVDQSIPFNDLTHPSRIIKQSHSHCNPPIIVTLPSIPQLSVTSKFPENDLLHSVERLFDLETDSTAKFLTPEETLAEDIFLKTTVRLPDGRFSVALPLKDSPDKLGPSRSKAIQRLYAMEKKLSQDSILRGAYCKFMQDYIDQGHMIRVPPPPSSLKTNYLPHHAVRRSGDPPEKIRVVFNASFKTNTGYSLNDLLLPGPRLQLNIDEVMTRFRLDKYVFTADIRQMFRQIRHQSQDQLLLRIVWRFSPDAPIQDFALSTVTYGTTSAPWLACRVIKELALSHSTSHPEVSQILSTRTYVDDLNGGADSIDEAISRRDQTIHVLASAQLDLRKWASNHPGILEGIPPDQCLPAASSINLHHDGAYNAESAQMKILGVCWNPAGDYFHYQLSEANDALTKRDLLSQIARVYDPLGLLSPIIIKSRIIFRQVAHQSFAWDSSLPPDVLIKWKKIQQELPSIGGLKIPRHVPFANDSLLIGFADASEQGFGCVIYVVTPQPGKNQIRLISSKAKVAPVGKGTTTIPRLELCAAQLLAKCVSKVLPLFPCLSLDKVIAFLDSNIALCWITANPAPCWKNFVGNRVADIQRRIPSSQWHYIPSAENPADAASRGLYPNEFIHNSLWREGPSWLCLPLAQWKLSRPIPNINHPTVAAETKSSHAVSAVTTAEMFSQQWEYQFSSLTKLVRSTAWLRRFSEYISKSDVATGPLTTEELRSALHVLVRRAQVQALSHVIDDIKGKRVSQLVRTLGLFLEENSNLVRINGRLAASHQHLDAKHPVLLPAHHHLTKLVVEHSHHLNLHGGPKITLGHLRQRFWIINGKEVVRRQLSQCNRCFQIKPIPFQPPMGQLPSSRIAAKSAFLTVGVDYAGPFHIKAARLRGTATLKAYMVVVVCFSTKAVHIEVASSLSTPAFIAAFRRFCDRRGNPANVYSDNGGNFVGAASELRQLKKLITDPEHRRLTAAEAAVHGTQWHFIPPRAPHFGGLWEAAVKQAKRLIYSTMKDQCLDLEAFQSLLTRVEAILNSRPIEDISPHGSDDIEYLTPGHFLILRPMTSAPPIAPDPFDQSTSLRGQYRHAMELANHFWKRWSIEFITSQQTFLKWNRDDSKSPPRIGQVVIIKEDGLPPLSWKLGRIVGLFPGPDNIHRVADSKWKYCDRPKIKNRNRASEKTFSYTHLLRITSRTSVCVS
ncbi:unnamed protein product, partial [Nesidiocoris tenuis]